MVVFTKKPKNVTVIEGFPGIGLVGTISTGFLVDHLKCEKIGSHFFDDVAPQLAIHQNKLIDPVTIYYNKEYNLAIIHSITAPVTIEWKAADMVLDVCKQLDAKEIITIEGVGSQTNSPKSFYYTQNSAVKAKFEKNKIPPIGEGIIIGVTAGLLQRNPNIPLTCVFAETVSKLPDSKAAAKIIETLDKYLNLKVDYKPLLKQAEAFEQKLRALVEHVQRTREIQEDKHQLDYLG